MSNKKDNIDTDNVNKSNTNINEQSNVIISDLDDNTILLTAGEQLNRDLIEQAVYNYNKSNHQYSSYYNDEGNSLVKVTIDDIDRLAFNAQNSIKNILNINQIVRYYINKDDILGKVYETIEGNINTDYELNYPNVKDNKTDSKLEKTKELIEDFNEQIDIENLITNSIVTTFTEGNYPMYLKKNGDSYTVDYFPMGVIEVSDYNMDNEPYLLMNIKELKSRLKKTNKKTKKGKSLFFNNIDDEIKKTYPKEVYQAYSVKDDYAKLNIENTGIIRINNMNRKYGLTTIFKALRPIIRLETIENSDIMNFKARGKKIICQLLDIQLLNPDFKTNVQWSEAMIKSHNDFMASWKGDPAILTTAPWVKDIKYVEPKTETANIATINNYRTKIMTALGIEFLNAEKGSMGVAQISIKELMKTINKIAKQLEKILNKWYKGILKDNNIDVKYAPKIKIINSELLETQLKIELAQFTFNTLGVSYQTAYELLGFDYEAQKQRRVKENEDEIDEIFYPRVSAYTVSGKDDTENIDGKDVDSKDNGRPESNEDTTQKEYDKERYKEGDK